MKGRLFVVSAPSGAGKTTLLKRIMRDLPGLAFSVSHTTRKPRPGECDGEDYHFISREKFLSMQEKGFFLESAQVHDNFYGTSREEVLGQIENGQDIILDIDVQGAAILRKDSSLEAVHIFIAPPNPAELERRLRKRGTEDESSIKLRVENAIREMASACEYHYLLVNDELDMALQTLTAIIIAERARQHRWWTGEPIELKGFEPV